ncbi:hypothetical protein [Sorangium sp. So ce233]|uniref:hypothetical protein n=1 Tax=Sorangium sp. So ce233 TaxID=3133290 RepID=UPI003F6183EE
MRPVARSVPPGPRSALSTQDRAITTLAAPPFRFAALHFFALRSGFFYLRARTRPTLPDRLPEDPDAEDTFTEVARRMVALVDRAVQAEGGQAEPARWVIARRAPFSSSNLLVK